MAGDGEADDPAANDDDIVLGTVAGLNSQGLPPPPPPYETERWRWVGEGIEEEEMRRGGGVEGGAKIWEREGPHLFLLMDSF